MGTYYSPSAPTVTEGYFLKPESRVLLGTSELYGALETSSWVYTTYNISIGLTAGNYVELGFLESLGWNYAPSWEAVDSANVASGTVYDMTDEEMTVTVGIREFNPSAIEFALGSGVRYNLGDEVVFGFGGGCELRNRPISIEWTNQACDAPESPDIASGVSGGILTVYDAIATSGFPWDTMERNNLNNVSLEIKGRPVNTLAAGLRIASLYLY